MVDHPASVNLRDKGPISKTCFWEWLSWDTVFSVTGAWPALLFTDMLLRSFQLCGWVVQFVHICPGFVDGMGIGLLSKHEPA